jgi:hypothetical protein
MKDQTTGASWIFFALFNLFFTTRRYYLGSLDESESPSLPVSPGRPP